MRVPGKFAVTTMPRGEAMELLAPRWDEFIHKGVVELAARQPGESPPSCTKRKRGRRQARRPNAGGAEEEARDKCPPPPPAVDPGSKKKCKDRKARNSSPDGGASATSGGDFGGGASASDRSVASGELELAAAPYRALEGQRVSSTWMADTGASLDIVSLSDALKTRILMKTLRDPLPFLGIHWRHRERK